MSDEGAAGDADVTRLPTGYSPAPPPPPSAPRGLHAFAIGAMAICALLGIALILALATVNWTPWSRRIVVIALVGTTIVFVSSALAAVFAGARATHRRFEGPENG